MKKLINTPETLVVEMCRGLALAHPELSFVERYKVIKKRDINAEKVTLISGGGSGHEPAHAGFVGKGMLDAAVCGDVFASPSQIQVYNAIRQTQSDKGTLLIIKNYSGDIMNFKNAAYMAEEEGCKVDYIKVEDDIAVNDSLYTVGRRGVAGTVFVHKVAGAAAERGMSLEAVKGLAQRAADRVKSLGFALTSCTVPAKGTPTFELGENEIEFGVGIHGEPGRSREPMQSADDLAEKIVEALLDALDLRKPERKGARIAVLVNGFGGTPLGELYAFNHAVTTRLLERDMHIAYTLVGNYMTSIDMAGASVSVMHLDDELETLLLSPCDAPALKLIERPSTLTASHLQAQEATSDHLGTNDKPTGDPYVKGDSLTLANMLFVVRTMSDVIIENEVPFCELDAHAGDGDFGMSIAKGFRQLRVEWDDLRAQHGSDIGDFLKACSNIIMEYCGGASGPIWGSAFRAAGRYAQGMETLDVHAMAEMLGASVEGIQKTGERSFGRGADIGDKTLMDALIPCYRQWVESAKAGEGIKSAFMRGAEAAVKGAKMTENIVARMGRAGTVGERSLGHPDAGAHALGVIFTELYKKLRW